MHRRFNPIREHLRKTYSVPGDILDAIMADTLAMAKDLPQLKLVATIRHDETNDSGEVHAFFEPAEDFDPEEFSDGEKLLLKNEKIVGSMVVTKDNKGVISKIESNMDQEIDTLPKDTEVFVFRYMSI